MPMCSFGGPKNTCVRTAGVGILFGEEGRDVLEAAALACADLPACTQAKKIGLALTVCLANCLTLLRSLKELN
jgi:hypothetical protein